MENRQAREHDADQIEGDAKALHDQPYVLSGDYCAPAGRFGLRKNQNGRSKVCSGLCNVSVRIFSFCVSLALRCLSCFGLKRFQPSKCLPLSGRLLKQPGLSFLRFLRHRRSRAYSTPCRLYRNRISSEVCLMQPSIMFAGQLLFLVDFAVLGLALPAFEVLSAFGAATEAAWPFIPSVFAPQTFPRSFHAMPALSQSGLLRGRFDAAVVNVCGPASIVGAAPASFLPIFLRNISPLVPRHVCLMAVNWCRR